MCSPRGARTCAAAAFAAAALVFLPVAAQDPTADPTDPHGIASDGSVLADEAPIVRLDDVLFLAAELAPTVLAEAASIEAAHAQLQEARAGSWPAMRATMGLAPAPRISVELDEDGQPQVADDERSELDLLSDLTSVSLRTEVTVTVPLTTFGRLRLARGAARIGIDLAEVEEELARRDAQFQAMRAYLAVQWYRRTDRLLDQAADRLDTAEEHLEELLDDGDRSARNSLRQLTIARAGFSEQRAQADAAGALARFALVRALGLDPEFRPESFDTDLPTPDVPSLDAVLQIARVYRHDYRRLDQAAAAAEIQTRIRRREFAPEIGVNFNLSSAFTPSVTDLRGPFIYDPYNRFTIGAALGLNWNLNIARSLARMDRADADLDRIEAERDAAWLGIELEVGEAYFDAVACLEIATAHAQALRAADAWLDQVGFQFDQGLAEFAEFEDPLKTYYETHGTYLKALLDYRLAVADLARVTGWTSWTTWPGAE